MRRALIVLAFCLPIVAVAGLGLLGATSANAVTGLRQPDLGMAPLADFTLDKPADGRTLLRFSATIVNVGSGPMEITATRGINATAWSVAQRVYGADGHVDIATPGANLVYGGDGHNHWHVNGVEKYVLDRLDNGVNVGTGAKASFCFFDTTQYRLTLPGAPSSSVYNTSTACSYGQPSATSATMGISVGWGDKYRYNLPDQWIDVTRLAAGKYRLRAIADPNGWFAESNESNNQTWVDLAVTVNRKGGSTIKIIATGPSA